MNIPLVVCSSTWSNNRDSPSDLEAQLPELTQKRLPRPFFWIISLSFFITKVFMEVEGILNSRMCG
jgi:hypothetical protein